MITFTPVARWIWGRDDETSDPLFCCLRHLLVAYGVLGEHRFAVGDPKMSISVAEAGKSNSFLFQEEFRVGSWHPNGVAQLVDRVRGRLRTGEIGSVDGYVECAGMVMVGSGDEEVQQESLFRLSASSFADFVSVELSANSDVWLAYDLEGRPQQKVYAANAPRLSALLCDLSQSLGVETDPDDPTYFAKPTQTGVENYFDSDGKASDVWRSFEVPTRYDVFTHAPGFGKIGYQRAARGEVRCVAVRDQQGELLGHLWASDSENAASFEPQDVSDDATYRAGLVWLDRLRSAHDRGLSPCEALAELGDLPDGEDDAGRVDLSEELTIPLARLRDGSQQGSAQGSL
ncbi:hypothetical protein [Streptomyces mexicanus]|uniref:Uncharacterized protein n=1 Tax=Streptomyces mexicanus TaxID=178566 RepID=A0A7X1LU28_9ACTN|nr:hypothetical protein [Streptomyces mexicanus]MBC2869454.1 hypothetical protein [Streptomyces mexicanus]